MFICVCVHPNLVDIIQTDVQVVFHGRILHFVFLRGRVGANIERLGSKRSVSRTEVSTEARTETAQACKGVLSFHAVHSIVEKWLKIFHFIELYSCFLLGDLTWFPPML